MTRATAVITGASSGIGLAFARRLTKSYDLLLIARQPAPLERAAAELRASRGGKVEVLSCDLSNPDGIALAAGLIATLPALGMLVNNAGFGSGGFFWESELAPLEQMQRLHISATLSLTHAALQNMVPRDTGAVINVSSMGAFISRAGSSNYRATKAWINAFTEGVHLELRAARSNVKIQALCPGFTQSEFHERRGVDSGALAVPTFWLTAEQVVDSSLAALGNGTFFEIPGWRYKVIAAILTRLPVRVRTSVLTSDLPFHRLCPGLTHSPMRRKPDAPTSG